MKYPVNYDELKHMIDHILKYMYCFCMKYPVNFDNSISWSAYLADHCLSIYLLDSPCHGKLLDSTKYVIVKLKN